MKRVQNAYSIAFPVDPTTEETDFLIQICHSRIMLIVFKKQRPFTKGT